MTHNGFRSDTIPGLDEKGSGLVPDFSHIAVRSLPEAVVVRLDDGSVQEGFLYYTDGLVHDSFDYELLAFSEEPSDEVGSDVYGLRSTAAMLALGAPHLVPVGLSSSVQQQLQALGLPNTTHVQVLVDEACLDHDVPTEMEKANWIPDGGLPLMTSHQTAVAVEAFFSELEESALASVEDILQHQREVVAAKGWCLNGVVDPNGEDTVFIYTTGLSKQQLPELLISGRFDTDDLAEVLGQAATYLTTHKNELGEIDGNLPPVVFDKKVVLEIEQKATDISVRIVEVEAASLVRDYLKQAESILEAPVSRVGCVQFSDPSGRWPGEDGFQNLFDQIEVQLLSNTGTA